ncbi:hypothetical protein ACLB2K_038096 [Fragaria x ananassa]
MDWALGNTVETESESFELESNSNSDSEDQDVEVDSETAPAENSLIPATKEPAAATPSPSTMTSLPPKPQKRSRKSSSAASSSRSRVRSMQEIEDLFNQRHLEAGSQTQKILLEMTSKMKTKFEKYFGSIDDINQLLLVALVLNPCYKLHYFQHICETELHYDSFRVKQKSDESRDLVFKLTDLYATSMATKKAKPSDKDAEKSSTTSKSSSCGSKTSSSLTRKRAAMQANWRQALEDSSQTVVSHEVDRYLLDPIEDPPEGEDWKLLDWWKLNGSKYPNLQLVAKDVLAIQVSTVASESCFSTSKRVIDPFRASLSPKTVEALICFQNWLRSESIQNLEYLPTIEDILFYEKVERDALKDTADSQHEKAKQKQVKKGKKLKVADQATKQKGIIEAMTTNVKTGLKIGSSATSSKKKMKTTARSVGSSKKTRKGIEISGSVSYFVNAGGGVMCISVSLSWRKDFTSSS